MILAGYPNYVLDRVWKCQCGAMVDAGKEHGLSQGCSVPYPIPSPEEIELENIKFAQERKEREDKVIAFFRSGQATEAQWRELAEDLIAYDEEYGADPIMRSVFPSDYAKADLIAEFAAQLKRQRDSHAEQVGN